jgi:hypothetical protein
MFLSYMYRDSILKIQNTRQQTRHGQPRVAKRQHQAPVAYRASVQKVCADVRPHAPYVHQRNILDAATTMYLEDLVVRPKVAQQVYQN